MTEENNQENKKTEEEIVREAEARKAEWEKFVEDMESKSDEPVTKGELVKVINFISENMGYMSQMINHNAQNGMALNHNLNMVVQALQGKAGNNGGPNRSNSGIIIP